MIKILLSITSILCWSLHSLQAQELLIEYPTPLHYEKIGDQLMADAVIQSVTDTRGITVELNGKKLPPHSLANGGLSLKLPLIGERSELVFKKNGKPISSQIFYPLIPMDWGYFKKGTIHIISSSHQDIAWMNTPDSCREERIHKIILPALDLMEKDFQFKFGMEQTLNLMEVLTEYPKYKTRISDASRKGLFGWGATFNQPYEGMESGEQLVRQLYLGRKWIHDTFNNEFDATTAFNVDVPGRTLQLPQLLHKAGVKHLFISRFKEGFYNWYSPDGSKIFTYSPGNYGWAVMFYKYFDADAPRAMNKLHEVLKNWNEYYATRAIPPHYAVVISNDAAGPIYYDKVLREWNAIVADSGLPLPNLQYSTADEFLSKVNVPEAKVDSIAGERPNLWLYIHGPAHYEAIKAKREASVYLPASEMFNTINGLLANDFSRYPKKQFDSAWYETIYSDHGWGGKHGNITDSIFRAYIEHGNAIAKKTLYSSLTEIAARVKSKKKDKVVVFNDLSWGREGIASVAIPNGAAYHIADSNGQAVPSQRVEKNGSASLYFQAKAPSIGYATYYPQKGESKLVVPHQVKSNYYENDFYKVELANGGIKKLYDKELRQEILNTTRFAGGDVLDMGYDGNDAGEFTQITTPNMNHYDKFSNHTTTWSIKNDGHLFTTFESQYVVNQVAYVQRITIYHQVKKIDFEIEVLNWKGVKNRRLSFAVPLHSPTASITYDVPLGISTVNKSELATRPGGWAWGGTYWHQTNETHPRESQNFVSATTDQFGITMSSSMAVFDWIDPTRDAVTYPVLQGIMLTSQKSCHGQGNWYLQKGKHTFNFSITTHKPGWKYGYAFGFENNHSLYSVKSPIEKAEPTLPQSMSFIQPASPFTLITAFKKSDYGNDVVIRFVEMEGTSREESIDLYKDVKSLTEINLIEQPGSVAPINSRQIRLPIQSNAIESFKINFQ
jgi:alpha-mannosidase